MHQTLSWGILTIVNLGGLWVIFTSMWHVQRVSQKLWTCVTVPLKMHINPWRAPLGMSDHSTVYSVPSNKPVLKSNKAERRLVLVWSEESTQILQDCFFCTDWDLFKNVSTDLDEITDTVLSYITFWEDLVITCKSISIQIISLGSPSPWRTRLFSVISVSNRAIWLSTDNYRNKLKLNLSLQSISTSRGDVYFWWIMSGMGRCQIYDGLTVQEMYNLPLWKVWFDALQ